MALLIRSIFGIFIILPAYIVEKIKILFRIIDELQKISYSWK